MVYPFKHTTTTPPSDDEEGNSSMVTPSLLRLRPPRLNSKKSILPYDPNSKGLPPPHPPSKQNMDESTVPLEKEELVLHKVTPPSAPGKTFDGECNLDGNFSFSLEWLDHTLTNSYCTDRAPVSPDSCSTDTTSSTRSLAEKVGKEFPETSPTSVLSIPKPRHRRVHSFSSGDSKSNSEVPERQEEIASKPKHGRKLRRNSCNMKSKTPPLPQLSLRRTASEPIKTRREDDSVDDLYKLSGAALQRSDYTAALALSEKILHYEQQKYGYYHAKVGNALHNVATVQLHAKRYKIAEPVFCEAVTVRIQALGNDHIDVATSLTKLGHVQTRLDKCDDAIKVFHDALRITRKLDDSLSAPILSHIGCLYYDAAEFMAAQTTFQDALFIYRKEGPKAYRFITEMLCNIGSIQSKRKNFEGAIHSFSEGLELQKIIYRDNDTKVIATLDNLGFAYSKNKEYAQALTCYKEMLRAQLALYGTYNKVCFQTVKKQNLMTEKLQNNSGDSVTRSPPIDPAQHSIHRISGSPPNYNLYMHASPP